jgi:hypothetical protein
MVRKIDLYKGWFRRFFNKGDSQQIIKDFVSRFGDLRKTATWAAAAEFAFSKADCLIVEKNSSFYKMSILFHMIKSDTQFPASYFEDK